MTTTRRTLHTTRVSHASQLRHGRAPLRVAPRVHPPSPTVPPELFAETNVTHQATTTHVQSIKPAAPSVPLRRGKLLTPDTQLQAAPEVEATNPLASLITRFSKRTKRKSTE
jgi:hypothetical protein